MRAEIKRLQMELEIAKKSGGILREGPAVRYAWIDQQVMQYPLSSLCRVLSVSVNGYRAWKRGGSPGRTRLADTQLLTLIRTVHAKVKGAYGSPRMTDELRDRGFPASRERVERLMHENGIRARHKRRYRVTTDSKHKLPVAPNLLNRGSRLPGQNRCSPRTSRTSGPMKAGCIWLWCWTCLTGKWWVGRSSRA